MVKDRIPGISIWEIDEENSEKETKRKKERVTEKEQPDW